MLSNGYEEQKIQEAFKKFSCQRETDLEDFLVHKAFAYEKANFGKTHLLVDMDKLINDKEFVVAAYFTTAQKSVDISEISKAKRKRMLGMHPGRDGLQSVPAYLIGQIGRNDAYTHEQLPGQQILNECYHTISLAAQVVGGNLIVLECREKMFERFYQGQDYKKLYDELNDEGLYTLYKKIDFSEYWKRNLEKK